MLQLKCVHATSDDSSPVTPVNLLNKISSFKLEEIFANVCTSLRIVCTLPVTVASAERSFSKLNLKKSFLRSTMTQERLNSLALLSIECEMARKVDFSNVIHNFATKKARKVAVAH